MQKYAMSNFRRLSAVILTIGLVAIGAILAARPGHGLAPNQTVKLAPHRAVYEMKLGDSRANSNVSGIVGRMVFELSGTPCEGYTVNMRLVTRVTDRSGKALMSDLRSSTWEEGDGEKFRFNSSQYLNQKLSELASGSAKRAGQGKKVDVQLQKPKSLKLALPTDVMFPAQHARAILAAALNGRTTLEADLYEGSEKGEKVHATTAFIGRLKPPGPDKDLKDVKNAEILDKLKSWPVSVGYYEKENSEEATPSYEVAYRYYANGVSRRLVIDYGDFSIHGSLQSLELLEETNCER